MNKRFLRVSILGQFLVTFISGHALGSASLEIEVAKAAKQEATRGVAIAKQLDSYKQQDTRVLTEAKKVKKLFERHERVAQRHQKLPPCKNKVHQEWLTRFEHWKPNIENNLAISEGLIETHAKKYEMAATLSSKIAEALKQGAMAASRDQSDTVKEVLAEIATSQRLRDLQLYFLSQDSLILGPNYESYRNNFSDVAPQDNDVLSDHGIEPSSL